LSRFEFYWIVLYRFEVVFGRLGSFWIVWERFGRLGLPNQITKSQIRQPYFREPLLMNGEGTRYHHGVIAVMANMADLSVL